MPLQPVSDNFDVNVDWEDVPESDLLPESTYELMITKAERGFTRSEKLAVELTYEVGGGELEGSRLRPETFTLGNDIDPQGIQPETRRSVFGWMNLKRLCNAVGVRYEQSLRMTVDQLPGRRFIGTVKVVTQADKNRDGSPNQYAGQQQNRITAVYPLGHQVVMQGGSQGGSVIPVNGPTPQRRMSAAEVLAQVGKSSEEIPGDPPGV